MEGKKVIKVRVTKAECNAWYSRLVPVIFDVYDLGNRYAIPSLYFEHSHDWATLNKDDCEVLEYGKELV